MLNDNTHTGIDWWGAINMSGHGETESSAFTACFGKELEQSDFEAICEWAVQTFLSRTPAEPKAVDDVPKFLRVLRGEPKAVDWEKELGRIQADAEEAMNMYGQDPDSRSWGNQEGVLISCAEAIGLVGLSRRALSSAAPRITESQDDK